MTVDRTAEGQWSTWPSGSPPTPGSTTPTHSRSGAIPQPSYAPGEIVELHISTTAEPGATRFRDGATFEMVHEVSGLTGTAHPVPETPWPPAAGGQWRPASRCRASGSAAATSSCSRGSGATPRRARTASSCSGQRSPAPTRSCLVVATYSWQEYNDWVRLRYFSDEYIDHTADLEVREKSFKPLQLPPLLVTGPHPLPCRRAVAQPPVPVGAAVGVPAADWAISNGYSVWTIANGWARYDALTVRWLEAEGYAPELISQWDLDRDPTILENYHAVVTTGHDEYWTATGRWRSTGSSTPAAATPASPATSCGRFAEDDLRTQVCHKYAAHADPSATPMSTSAPAPRPPTRSSPSRPSVPTASAACTAHGRFDTPRAGRLHVYRPDH